MVKKGDTVITCDNKVGLVVTSSNYDNMYTPTGAVISVRLANDATDIHTFVVEEEEGYNFSVNSSSTIKEIKRDGETVFRYVL